MSEQNPPVMQSDPTGPQTAESSPEQKVEAEAPEETTAAADFPEPIKEQTVEEATPRKEEALGQQMEALFAELAALRSELRGHLGEENGRQVDKSNVQCAAEPEPTPPTPSTPPDLVQAAFEASRRASKTGTASPLSTGLTRSTVDEDLMMLPTTKLCQVKVVLPPFEITHGAAGPPVDIWAQQVLPYRHKDKVEDVTEQDIPVRQLFLQRLQEELRLGRLEEGKVLPPMESETFKYSFSPDIPGLSVTVVGTEFRADDPARGCRHWRALSGVQVTLLRRPKPPGDDIKKLQPDFACAIARGCTVDHVEDTWALIEAVVQVVAQAVDEWGQPDLKHDNRGVAATDKAGEIHLHLTDAPRACDAHVHHKESDELWKAVTSQDPKKVARELERLRCQTNGCDLIHHALQHRRVVEFDGGCLARGKKDKAERQFTGPVLYLALQLGEVHVVEELLKSKADPNETYMMTPCGRFKAAARMPLLFAALYTDKGNCKDLLRRLLDHDADVNARSTFNSYVHSNLLWEICWSNHCNNPTDSPTDVLSFLLDRNADLNTANGWYVDNPPMPDVVPQESCPKLLARQREQRTGSKVHPSSSSPANWAQTNSLLQSGGRASIHTPCLSFEQIDNSLRFCPGRKYTALGLAVKKGAPALVTLLVAAKAEVTRHELMIAVTISNAGLVRTISRASASGESPGEALLLLHDFNRKEKDNGSACVSAASVQDPKKERLYYSWEVSRVHKDLLYEMVDAVVADSVAVDTLKKQVRGDIDFDDPASDPLFLSRLIRHSPEAAALLLDNIYLQEPDCSSSRNPVPVQCFLDGVEQMNTVYIENDRWHKRAQRQGGSKISMGRSRTLEIIVHGAHNLRNTDTGLMGDLSDPYVAIKVGQTRQKTSVVANNLNPVWDTKNRFTFCVGELDFCVELDVKNANIGRDDSLGKVMVNLGDLRAGEWIPHRSHLEGGDGAELEFDLQLTYNKEEEVSDWQLELLGQKDEFKIDGKQRQFCNIRIIRIKQIIRLELFNAIASVPRADRLKLLQNSEALQAVIHYTWVTWAKPQHLVLLAWSTIQSAALLVWVVIILLSSREVVSSFVCQKVVMMCWAQFAASAFLEVSDDLATVYADWKLSDKKGLAKLRGILNNADAFDWVQDAVLAAFTVAGWGTWKDCAFPKQRSLFAAALLICCCNLLYSMRPFRGLGYALVPILDTLSPITTEKGKVSNLVAMLTVVFLLVIATGLFAVIEFSADDVGVWPIYVKTFMNVIVGEAELLDLDEFSDSHFRVVAVMAAFFGIGVVLMNIFIAVVGESYSEMLEYNLGSFLDRRNQICEKAVMLRRICLQYTANFISWSGPLGAPSRRKGITCLFGLITPLQATLIKQVFLGSPILFVLIGLANLQHEMDLLPLLIFVAVIVIMLCVKYAVILSHTLEPQGGIRKGGKLWFVPCCYVWVAKCPQEVKMDASDELLKHICDIKEEMDMLKKTVLKDRDSQFPSRFGSQVSMDVEVAELLS